MYFRSLPDHSQPGFDESLHFSRFKQQNIIFNALSSESHCDRHVGCLSIKTVMSGEEWYGVDHRQLAVRPGQFLILNDDQQYSCRIEPPEPVRVQSVFFRNSFVGAVMRDALDGEEASLDVPFDTGGAALNFFQTLHDTDTRMAAMLSGLVGALDAVGYDRTMVDERMVFLLRHLIGVQQKEVVRARMVNALKLSTRMEIYKRLCIAKDLLHSQYMDTPDLDVICQAACMSMPQLIRQFKVVFQMTPYQYLIRIRLGHAARMLEEGVMPVHEITWRCGWENASAFCRAFRAAYGVAPMEYRGR